MKLQKPFIKKENHNGEFSVGLKKNIEKSSQEDVCDNCGYNQEHIVHSNKKKKGLVLCKTFKKKVMR